MSTVALETSRAFDLLERVEKIERVAGTLSDEDPRRLDLMSAVKSDLAAAAPLRPLIAARMLELSEKTVRTWAAKGVLKRASGHSRRLLLDPQGVHEVLHLVREIRQHKDSASLLEEVQRRIADATWLSRSDLADSLDQMNRGEGTVRVRKPSP